MYLEKYGYGAKMDQIENELKQWVKEKEVTFERYDNLKDEQVGRYQKVEIKAFAYKKL